MSSPNGATADRPQAQRPQTNPPSAWRLLRNDLSELLSVQARLFTKESRGALHHAYLAAEVVAAGLVIAAIAGALLFFGGADELHAHTELTLGQCRLIIGAVLSVIAIILLRKGFENCRAAGHDFDVSVDELRQTTQFLSELVAGREKPSAAAGPSTPSNPSSTSPTGGTSHVRRF
jgi:hypothetical protein